MTKNNKVLNYFNNRGLNKNTIEYFKLRYSKDKKTVEIPHFKDKKEINTHYRNLINEEIKYFFKKNGEIYLYNTDNIDKANKICYLFEGEFDMMIAHQWGIKNVLSLPNGTNSTVWKWKDFFEGFEKIYLCFDNDNSGQEAAKKTAEELGYKKCWNIVLDKGKDLTEFYQMDGTLKEFQELIDNAKQFKKIVETAQVKVSMINDDRRKEEAKAIPFDTLIKFDRNNKCKCLWHNEKTPSLSWDKKTNRIKCFGCGVSFDTIGFIQDRDGLGFMDAVKYLTPHYTTKQNKIIETAITESSDSNLSAEQAGKKKVDRNIVNEELKKIFVDNKKLGIHKIAKHLVKKYKFIAVADKENEELYIYANGIYNLTGTAIIKKETEEILEEQNGTHYRNEIISKVKALNLISREKFDSNTNDNLICVNNGILNLITRELLPHSPDIIYTSKIPINYNKDAECPEIKKFFKDILYEEDIKPVQEWFGFCLLRKYLFKKAMIFVGEGNTGKSTLLDLLVEFIGNENVSEIGLAKLSTNAFASARLYQKLVNISDDLDFKDMIDVGRFKTVCGKAPIDAEKKFGEIFHFINYAKLTFTANRIPPLKDKDINDSAYYSRWIIVQCDNELQENEIEPNFIEKITTPKELSGLLNYALDGKDRLLSESKFSYSKTWEEIKNIMERSSSPLASFVQDELVLKENAWVSKDDMFKAYNDYASKNKTYSMTKDKLGKQLPRYAYYILEGRQLQERGWLNVELKNPEAVSQKDKVKQENINLC